MPESIVEPKTNAEPIVNDPESPAVLHNEPLIDSISLGPIGTSNALRVAEPDDHHMDIDNAFFDTSLSEVVTSLGLTNTNVDNPKGHESSKKTK